MKTTTTLLLAIFCAVAFAQPVSGFLGKKLMTSLEMEIIPGLQDYEANTSDFLYPGEFFDANSRNYTPRFFINTDYQFKRNLVVSGALGYVRLQVPFEFLGQNSSGKFVRPMNSIPLQIRLKKGKNGGLMPTSSNYFAYGVGIHFLSMPSVPFISESSGQAQIDEVSSVTATNLYLNVEWGRRVVFNHGIVLDFGVVGNISSAIGGFFTYYDYTDVVDEVYTKKQMKTRDALNSLVNFKIGIGFFY